MRIGSMYVLRPSRVGDAREIAPHVRPVDRDEWDASGPGGLEHLDSAIQESAECWTLARAESPMEPHLIGGVNPLGGTNSCWLIGTPLAERDAPWIMQETRQFWADLFRRWPTLECWSDARNAIHHRWLVWMGFRLQTVRPWGHLGLPFHHYVRG